MSGFLLCLLIGVACGILLGSFFKSSFKSGIWGTSLAGILGALIGGYMPNFHTYGFSFDRLAVIPSFIGAIISVLFFSFISRTIAQNAQ